MLNRDDRTQTISEFPTINGKRVMPIALLDENGTVIYELPVSIADILDVDINSGSVEVSSQPNTILDSRHINAQTNAVKFIDYEHHELHSGRHFFVQSSVDLSINNVFDMQFLTANTNRWSHFTFQLDCESETNWWIYENVAVVTQGTQVTPINNNRNSSYGSGNTVKTIENSSLANANADTAVATATLLASGVVGAGRDGGSVERNKEIILKQNTMYCMRAEAVAAGYIAFNAQWYEHTDAA